MIHIVLGCRPSVLVFVRSLGLATLCALALAAVAPEAVAQSALPDSGAHVRIRLRSDTGFAQEGDLLARPADSVIMRMPGGAMLRAPRRDVQRLQVATVARRTGAGIGIGLLTGASSAP